MKISIIIPVYNEERYLAACLDTIARQTLKPAEVIVVDNNSTDGTVHVARRYPFVTVITEKRQGSVFARNAGFRAATSDIIARIDADTRLPPQWIDQIHKAFRKSAVAAVTGRPEFYDAAFIGLSNKGQVLLYQRLQKLLTGTYILWGANMAIRRQAWQAVRDLCTERSGIDEDIDLSFWLHKKGFNVAYLPDLPARASFQRGRTGILYTIRYLTTWPRDYFLHRMYVRSLLIVLIIILGLIIVSPFLLIASALPKTQAGLDT